MWKFFFFTFVSPQEQAGSETLTKCSAGYPFRPDTGYRTFKFIFKNEKRLTQYILRYGTLVNISCSS